MITGLELLAYLAVAAAMFATGWIAHGLRDKPQPVQKSTPPQ